VIINIDGQYPPLGVAEYNGYKVGDKLWKKWPFIFWEPGRQLTTILQSLLNSFGHRTTLRIKVREMMQQNLMNIDVGEQCALNLRQIKRASNWVANIDEEPLRETFLHAYFIVKRLSQFNLLPERFQKISEETLVSMDSTLEIILGQRINVLLTNIKKMEQAKMVGYPLAYTYLNGANVWKDKASFSLRSVQNLNRAGKNTKDLLIALAECLKFIFLSLDGIRHATKDLPEKEYVYAEIYKQLYKTFPPKMLTSLEMMLFK
jgi:hypothetical protein